MRGSSRIIRLVLVLAVGLAWTLILTPQQAAAETKTAPSAYHVYTNTGTWAYGGRTWVTNCTKFSSTVDRCETKIWAKVTEYTGGKFVTVSKWAFNNLTYKPSPRSGWSEYNVLVTPGEQTIDGRKWKTECDTAWTGSNACRTQIWATVPELKDGKWTNVNKWVFNNIVHVTPVACAVKQADLRKIIANESIVIDFCLQSKTKTNWLALQYVLTDDDGQLFTETAFFEKTSSGWGLAARGSLNASSICTFYKESGVPLDLADTISYCFNG